VRSKLSSKIATESRLPDLFSRLFQYQ